MKIGILTLPLHTNYGGVLQAYALYMVLKKMGHSVRLIDDKLYTIETIRERASLVLWNAMRLIGLRNTPHPQLCIAEEMKNFLPFITQYLPNQISVAKIKKDTFDAIIVGSDQIWRGTYSKDLMRYFLDFTAGWPIKRYAYAASFGTDDWGLDNAALIRCRNLVRQFDYVSTREKSGVDICKKQLGIAAHWVIDPTMLLTSSEYLSLCNNPIRHGGMVSYVLDNSEAVHEMEVLIARRKGLSINNLQKFTDGQHKDSIEHWLQAIAWSDFVFTDSFHGTVFSILFNKPFIVCGNKERGQSRFETLLSMTGLTDRMTDSLDKIPEILSKDIDWEKVNGLVRNERKRCLCVLHDLTKQTAGKNW